MFTGIVQEVGTAGEGGESVLTIAATVVLEGTSQGDSIAVNGACLTVKALGDGWTVVTADGALSAHFEDTVAITKSGAEVLSSP